jgi:hypothetical protein
LIDHILVTVDALGEYEGGWTETLRLDTEVLYYSYYVSDHRPVMSQFPVDMSAVISEGGVEMPQSARLVSVYPNPGNPETVIEYEVGSGSNVRLTVYNVMGQEVAVLVDEFRHAGEYRVRWIGTDSQGNSVPSGVYFVALDAGLERSVRKMVLMK